MVVVYYKNVIFLLMRTLVIGDIHGGLLALKEVLEKALVDSEDTLVFLGDYVDGWSESAETITFLMELRKEINCVFIRGNHDELLYNYLKHGQDLETWREHGGNASKKSYQRLSKNEIKKHITFLEDLKFYHVDENNRLYVHGGFSSHRGPKFEYYPHMVMWDRSLWEMVCAMDSNLTPEDLYYPNRLKYFHEIFIGHTPVTRIGETVPTRFANVWNIDTGAAFKGSLSIMDVETKEYWQSTPVYQLYEDEIGRN